jgi:putative inorganic carbon (hco3(-)) transporter
MPVGLYVTLFLICLSVLSPAEMFPWMNEFRPIVTLTALAGLATLMSVPGYSFKAPQLWMLGGFGFIFVFSRFMAQGRPGAAVTAIYDFAIFSAPFVFLAINLQNVKYIKTALKALTILGLLVAYSPLAALYFSAADPELFILQQPKWDVTGTVVLEVLNRVRALGFLSDPNDLAQEMIALIPLSFVFWKKESAVSKLWVLGVNAVFLLVVYNTQSRGALIGLAVLVALYFRKRVGNTVSLLAVAGLVVLSTLLDFGGGREMSIDEGSARGRVDAWSDGLQMLKRSPIWGVGFNKFVEISQELSGSRLTAHNSFVLCFAELGIIGYFFWLSMLFLSFKDLIAINQPVADDPATIELARLANLVQFSLASFLTTAFFLSRTYELTLYVLIALAMGLAEVERKRAKSRLQPWTMKWSGQVMGLEFASIAIIYVLARLRGA